MADVPQTTNGAASVTDTVLRTIFQVALPIAEAAEVAAVPFLGIWPISALFNIAQEWIANQIRLAIAMQTTFFIIDFETEQERNDFADAALALKAAISKGDLNDPELLKKAAALDAAFSKLVHSDGSYSPIK